VSRLKKGVIYMKKHMNFTEKLGLLIVIFGALWIQQNYLLAFLARQDINSAVTCTIITTIIGTFIGLVVKSLGEKMTANSHHINVQTGLPFEMETERHEEYYEGHNDEHHEEHHEEYPDEHHDEHHEEHHEEVDEETPSDEEFDEKE